MVTFFLSCFCAFALFSIITWKDIYLFFIFFVKMLTQEMSNRVVLHVSW